MIAFDIFIYCIFNIICNALLNVKLKYNINYNAYMTNILLWTNNNDNYHHNNSMNDNYLNSINPIKNEEGGI